MDFHQKWGHLNFRSCLDLLKMESGKVDQMMCPECELSKSIRKKAPTNSITRADQPIYRLHMDLSGRKNKTLKLYRYYTY
jgi:hypothetical protein